MDENPAKATTSKMNETTLELGNDSIEYKGPILPAEKGVENGQQTAASARWLSEEYIAKLESLKLLETRLVEV